MVSEVARRVDVGAGQIYRWRKEFGAVADGFAPVLIAAPERLERGRFIWPSPAAEGGTVAITAAQLAYMLDGIDWRIRCGRGGQKPPGEVCGGLTQPCMAGAALLPTCDTPARDGIRKIAALTAALAAEREAGRGAGFGRGGAGAYYKLQIARLRREQYGQSSERGSKLLDQLELQLEEAAAAATEDKIAGRPGRQHDGVSIHPQEAGTHATSRPPRRSITC